MEWSPQNAIEAYLQTLHLCKANNTENGNKRQVDHPKLINTIEPQGLELISALAAGNQAKSIIQISTPTQNGVVSPLTHALAVAAKQTSGKLTCIVLPTQENPNTVTNDNDNNDGVVEFRVGDPCDVVRGLGAVDFVVVDCGVDVRRLGTFFEEVWLNAKGAIVVANDVVHREQGVVFVDKVLSGMIGVKSSISTIPLGSTRVQVIIRVKSLKANIQKRRHKRFLVTYDA